MTVHVSEKDFIKKKCLGMHENTYDYSSVSELLPILGFPRPIYLTNQIHLKIMVVQPMYMYILPKEKQCCCIFKVPQSEKVQPIKNISQKEKNTLVRGYNYQM